MPQFREKIDYIRHTLTFELVFFVLALFSLSFFIYELSGGLTESEIVRLLIIDSWIAVLFLLDFFVGFLVAKNKHQYLKNNWYLLLASLSFNEYPLRLLRALRVLRIIRMAGVLSRNEHIHDDLPKWLRKMMRKPPKSNEP